MANRIKGITIEIGGDTTKLSDALKGANAEIKECQSALKDVNKLLKLDPGNADLLVQKQKYLSQAIGNFMHSYFSEYKKCVDLRKTTPLQKRHPFYESDTP